MNPAVYVFQVLDHVKNDFGFWILGIVVDILSKCSAFISSKYMQSLILDRNA